MIDEIPERDHNSHRSTTNSMSLRRLAILLSLVFVVLVSMLLGSRALDTLALKLWPAPMPAKSIALQSPAPAPALAPNPNPNVTVVQTTNPAADPASAVLDPTVSVERQAPIPQPLSNGELAAAGNILNPLSSSQPENATHHEGNIAHNSHTALQEENKTDLRTPIHTGNTVNENPIPETSQEVIAPIKDLAQTLPETKEDKELKVQQNGQASKEPKNKKDAKQYTVAEKEILKHDPRHYTVQILGMHNKAKLQSFVNETKLKGKVRYCRGSHQGKPWYVLVYGNYGTKEEAQKVLAELPEEIKKQKPWVRSFASLQGTIHARE